MREVGRVEDDESMQAASRLEAALELIAQRAQSRLAALELAPAPLAPALDTDAMAGRLDGLIAQIRGALDKQ